MSGPIIRRYGFPNFEKIFGNRELQHGSPVETPSPSDAASPVDPSKPAQVETPAKKEGDRPKS